MCHPKVAMRAPEIIEAELMEIGAIADDTIKLERIIAWCASHPDEIPFALHQLIGRRNDRA
jgi:hypothetical protein